MLTCLDLQPITAMSVEAKLLKYFVWQAISASFFEAIVI